MSFNEEKGASLLPLKIYFKKSFLKVEIGMCIGKKKFDKRHNIKEKDWNIKKQRILKKN